MCIARGETIRVYGANQSSSNDRLEKTLVAKCLITVRPTVMSKVNRVAYIDEPIYGPSLPSADSSLTVLSVTVERLCTWIGRLNLLVI